MDDNNLYQYAGEDLPANHENQFSSNALEYCNARFNEQALRDKLSIVAFFITVYECFKDNIIQDIQSIFMEAQRFGENGLPEYDCSIDNIKYRDYRNCVLSLKEHDGVPYDTIGATMLWLKNHNAISNSDYNDFHRFRALRNNYAHNMVKYVVNGVTMEEYQSLGQLIALFKKIKKWFFVNIDGPRTLPEGFSQQDIESLQVESPLISMFEAMANKLKL